MLYICIPVHDEAPTIGVLLWRIRKVFQEYSREYEVLVYNDGSTDATAETLEPYREVLPLAVLGERERVGYGRALDALLRAASQRTRYPRRDALVLMQGDFTDQPEHLPELVKRFEGGADIVVAERGAGGPMPKPVRQLRRVAPWVLRPFVSVPGVSDLSSSFKLLRISVVRDLLKELDSKPLIEADGWAANVELLVKASRFARRIETVELSPRYDLRPRPTRIRPVADALNLWKFGWGVRSRRATVVSR